MKARWDRRQAPEEVRGRNRDTTTADLWEVRRLSGREPGASEDSLKAALKREQETARDLRAENLDLRKQLQAMASVNEALRQEVRILHATGHAKVVSFVPGAPTR